MFEPELISAFGLGLVIDKLPNSLVDKNSAVLYRWIGSTADLTTIDIHISAFVALMAFPAEVLLVGNKIISFKVLLLFKINAPLKTERSTPVTLSV